MTTQQNKTADNRKTAREVDYPRCGVKTASGKPCRNRAGMGTNHPGVGPCLYHDKDANRPAIGRHLPGVILLDPEMRNMVVHMLQNDAELTNLRYELAMLKGKLLRDASSLSVTEMTKLASTIARLTATLHDVEVGKHLYIHVNVLAMTLQAVGRVAAQYLPEDRRNAFANDLHAVLKDMLPKTTKDEIATSALVLPIRDSK